MMYSIVVTALMCIEPGTDPATPKPIITGLRNPLGVTVDDSGRIYVVESGTWLKSEQRGKGDGKITLIENGKSVPFVSDLNFPCGIAAFQKWLFVCDENCIKRIDRNGNASVFVTGDKFPAPVDMLGPIAIDPESGTLFVANVGTNSNSTRTVIKIPARGKPTVLISEADRAPILHPFALVNDGASFLLMANISTMYRINVADHKVEKLIHECGRGFAWDHHGRLFFGDKSNKELFALPRPGADPQMVAREFKQIFGLSLGPSGKKILVTDTEAGTLSEVPTTIPGWEVDESPLPLQTNLAFPDLKWEGFQSESDSGKPNELRTIGLTNAGDGSNRNFVLEQHGTIYVFPNDPKATEAKVFLDLRDRVTYNDNMNEEGLLGLAFHPHFKENGKFFVYYTTKKNKLTNVLSRFRLRKDDPTHGDPDSEEELMRFQKPFWNHDGGTLCIGPDGYLYLTHGDGGAANDPHDNGQNLNSLLGKVMRIDVDRKDPGKNYAIPKDNPFADRKDARPEIWAYGLRNIWRMAFDKATGQLWAADVGQNLYEEIDIITKGGNYGWNRREGLHPFGPKGTGHRPEYIDPIWEYHHALGKSITGGSVYRGSRLSELQGYYIYGDYVSAKIWALKYDEAKKRVVANRPIKDRNIPVFSFGEDEQGEIYLLTATRNGQGIYRFDK